MNQNSPDPEADSFRGYDGSHWNSDGSDGNLFSLLLDLLKMNHRTFRRLNSTDPQHFRPLPRVFQCFSCDVWASHRY